MDTETKLSYKEKEQIKLERLKVYGNIVTVLITVALGTFGVALINHSFQNRQLKQQQLVNEAELQLQREKAESDRRQAEMQYLGTYLEHALQDDISRRLRFAEYFAMLTLSPDLQERWNSYRTTMENDILEHETVKKELEQAQASGEDIQALQELQKRNALLEWKLSRLEPTADYSWGFTPSQTPSSGELDQKKLRARSRLPLEMEFLNTLSHQLRNDLSEQERKNISERIMSVKLMLLKSIWDTKWGDFEEFQAWANNGARDPVPEELDVPAEYYRYGEEEGQ